VKFLQAVKLTGGFCCEGFEEEVSLSEIAGADVLRLDLPGDSTWYPPLDTIPTPLHVEPAFI
jgi:hypothetical protein